MSLEKIKKRDKVGCIFPFLYITCILSQQLRIQICNNPQKDEIDSFLVKLSQVHNLKEGLIRRLSH